MSQIIDFPESGGMTDRVFLMEDRLHAAQDVLQAATDKLVQLCGRAVEGRGDVRYSDQYLMSFDDAARRMRLEFADALTKLNQEAGR